MVSVNLLRGHGFPGGRCDPMIVAAYVMMSERKAFHLTQYYVKKCRREDVYTTRLLQCSIHCCVLHPDIIKICVLLLKQSRLSTPRGGVNISRAAVQGVWDEGIQC